MGRNPQRLPAPERWRTQELNVGGHGFVGGVLSQAVEFGLVLADDGNLYTTVQAAENAASNWIFIGPGTFDESVTIDTADLTVWGSGRGTLIDGQTSDAITINAANVRVGWLSVQTTAGGGNAVDGITTGANADTAEISHVLVRDSDQHGINFGNGNDHRVSNITVEAVDENGIVSSQVRTLVADCVIQTDVGGDGINVSGADSVLEGHIINGVGDDGVVVDAADVQVADSRILGPGGDGIEVTANGSDTILSSIRATGATGSNINDSGTSTQRSAVNGTTTTDGLDYNSLTPDYRIAGPLAQSDGNTSNQTTTSTSYTNIYNWAGAFDPADRPPNSTLYGRFIMVLKISSASETVSAKPIALDDSLSVVDLTELEITHTGDTSVTLVDSGWVEITSSVGSMLLGRQFQGKVTGGTGTFHFVRQGLSFAGVESPA